MDAIFLMTLKKNIYRLEGAKFEMINWFAGNNFQTETYHSHMRLLRGVTYNNPVGSKANPLALSASPVQISFTSAENTTT